MRRGFYFFFITFTLFSSIDKTRIPQYLLIQLHDDSLRIRSLFVFVEIAAYWTRIKERERYSTIFAICYYYLCIMSLYNLCAQSVFRFLCPLCLYNTCYICNAFLLLWYANILPLQHSVYWTLFSSQRRTPPVTVLWFSAYVYVSSVIFACVCVFFFFYKNTALTRCRYVQKKKSPISFNNRTLGI